MKSLRHTLICDGRTDGNLIPIINWTLKEMGQIPLANGVLAELWRLPKRPKTLQERISKAVELFPCEVLFIHRDAEKESPKKRNAEIRAAFLAAKGMGCNLPVVTVIPVRMLEAWLLFNESAIRQAAGNPNGKEELNLPPLSEIEGLPDPKKKLHEALRIASELKGRRLKKFDTSRAFWRVLDFLTDFSPLRELPAFLAFEKAVCRIKENNWTPGFYGIE